ncbi:MAG: phosphatidate cytidylyltransferase [Burkholderiaceae bacterium]|nr:MAG: phosphatidate cytidylyltransferase [Burkholderiaceae bacterium]
MLITRVITAVVLLAVLLPVLFFAPVVAWALLTLAVLAAGGWEWARMFGMRQPLWLAALILVLGLGWIALFWSGAWPPQMSRVIYVLAASFWLLLAPWLLLRQRNILQWRSIALPVLLAAWLALVEARQQGILFMLSIMLLVWAADIGAYFAGKRFGKHKLAPAISPGKTWEGVAGGLLAAILLSVWLATADWSGDSYFARIAQHYGLGGLLPMVIVLVSLSIVGDLFESLLKRQAGIKDSSGLLPGHGGVLDRIDALLPVLPVAMLFYFWSVA